MFSKSEFDFSVRPQDNFYQHINANWLKNNPIPSYESRWGTFLKLREDNWKRLHVILEELAQKTDLADGSIDKKLRDFYVSAIDPQKCEPAGLPYLTNWLSKVDGASSIQELLTVLFELEKYDISVPWAHYVDIDEKNSEQYIFRLHQAGLGMPDRDYYFKTDEAMQKVRTEYEAHIPRMLSLAGYANTEHATEHVLVIEHALAEASMTRTERRNIEAQYNKKTMAELGELAPNIDWQSYFVAVECPAQAEVLVDQPKFLQVVSELLKSQPLEVWQDYVRWHIVSASASYLGERFEAAQFLFYGKAVTGTQELQPRWKRVVMQMDGAIGEALGQKFVERHFPQKAKERMAVLVQDLKDAFSARLEKLPWMSEQSKAYAQEKLRKLRLKIGHPDKWRDYTNMRVQEHSYLENMFEASRFEIQRNFKKLGGPVDAEEWHMTPQTVNAYAHFNLNEIVFPAGILQPPFFDFEAEDAANYGGIGYVIGHEITHGFDDNGSQFDAEGNFRNWRTKEDKKNFDARAKVFEEQASKFEVLPGLFINGQLTLGENIGDLGGMEIALDAYQRSLARTPAQDLDGYTPAQRFFISTAVCEAENERDEKIRNRILTDPHSPAIFRTNGVVRNIDRFHEAFGVKEGDGMYLAPEQRVKIW